MRLTCIGMALLLLVVAPHAGCKTRCTEEGGIYTAHDRSAACCDGLVDINKVIVPDPEGTYEGDDMPEGCGGDAYTPPDIMVCIACPDGVCGLGEHYCNCPDDCPRPM